MTAQTQRAISRAVVLGGGGVTGIAWEIGILTGLLEAGIHLHEADTIIGTSAGSFVGVALASGYDMSRLFASQLESNTVEIAATFSRQAMKTYAHALKSGGSDPQRIGAILGAIARENPEPIPIAQRRHVVESRLVTTEWPPKLQVTVIDAESGQLHVFNQMSGVALTDAVMASGAIPGIWPLMHINGKAYIDGGMVSTTNARLADGYERVLILAPMPAGNGSLPGAVEDVAAMSANANVVLITPDEQSVAAIGPNPLDPARRGVVAHAGRAQGQNMAAKIADMW